MSFARPLGRLLASAGTGLVFFVSASALEIPLKQGEEKASRVGFVDMEQIFREYPDTQKAKAEYAKELERQRAALADQEQQLRALEEAAAAPPEALPAVSTAAPVGLSSAPAAAPPPAVPTVTAAQLEERRKALAQAKQASAKTLRDLEDRRSKQILGTLYQALTQLADEKGITVVVDKSAILYGQPAVDLTEALSRRVQGLPEKEE